MNESIWAVGLMTGTVLDGDIDVALVRTDGENILEFGDYSLEPYDARVISCLQETLQVASEWQFQGAEPAIFAEAEKLITESQTAAVANVLERNRLKHSEIGIVGFHGQSVLHRAPSDGQPGQTRQLGDGNLMAELLAIPVAWDFRSEDVAQGGQGAPLAAVYHRALLNSRWLPAALSSVPGFPSSVAVLNLGGVANLTWWGGGDELVAFDTGPANAPINDWVSRNGGGPMDRDGMLAAAGQCDEAHLQRLLDHAYFNLPYPKSLDRNDFSAAMAEGLSLADGARLLTEFSAAAVAKALGQLPRYPHTLILCGGGGRNPVLVEAIERRTGANAVLADEFGWRGDALEAECFGYLAVRVMRELPLSFPSTTGVPSPCYGGKLSYPF